MNYNVQYDNQEDDLMTRLLKIRKIEDNSEKFLDPKINDYWIDPFLLSDMEKAVDRIVLAMQQKEKIMVFGDYDVDGVTSSWLLYEFFRKFLDYHNVSITFPNRMSDGYGLKKNHVDDIKAKHVDLIITVDNGITSVNEALYVKELGMDLIITDHHHPLENIPAAFAVINPQISPDYPFKGIAGVGVAFKLIMAIMTKSTMDKDKKNQIFNYFLPVVTIGTVADVAPIVGENRAIVKRGLELMNSRSEHLPKSILGFINFLNLKDNIDTYHIGFMIGPRINAGGRLESPYQSLYALMYEGEKQLQYLQNIDNVNTERKRIQEEMLKNVEKMINHDHKILVAESCDFHEGVVGIVSGRITEKYCKPSVVFKIDTEKGQAVGSLRGPEYFNVIEMISKFGAILERFGGHKQAGGVTVLLANLAEFKEKIIEYCNEYVKESDIKKIVKIDTKIYHDEWNIDTLSQLSRLAPFGEGNKEPVFMLEDIQIQRVEKVGNKERTHLKVYGKIGDADVTSLFWGRGEDVLKLSEKQSFTVVGKVKKDTFSGGFFLDGVERE